MWCTLGIFLNRVISDAFPIYCFNFLVVYRKSISKFFVQKIQRVHYVLFIFIVFCCLLTFDDMVKTVSSREWIRLYCNIPAFTVKGSLCRIFIDFKNLFTAASACFSFVSAKRHTICLFPRRPIMSFIRHSVFKILAHWQRQ